MKQLFGKPCYGGHRSAYLMTHVGHELFLGSCQVFGFVPGTLQGDTKGFGPVGIPGDCKDHQGGQEYARDQEHGKPAVGPSGKKVCLVCLGTEYFRYLIFHLGGEVIKLLPDPGAGARQLEFLLFQFLPDSLILLFNPVKVSEESLLIDAVLFGAAEDSS